MSQPLELGYVVTVLLGILGFVGALAVNALMSIAKSVNEIKTQIGIMATKHDALEKRVEDLEDK